MDSWLYVTCSNICSNAWKHSWGNDHLGSLKEKGKKAELKWTRNKIQGSDQSGKFQFVTGKWKNSDWWWWLKYGCAGWQMVMLSIYLAKDGAEKLEWEDHRV